MSFSRNILALLAVAIACGVFATPAAAITFNVNRVDDLGNASQLGICDVDLVTPGEQCTLRAAIESANNTQAVDTRTINLPAGTYSLSLGPLFITSPVDLVGAGARSTIIRQTGLARVFEIEFSTTSISGVTMRDGTADSFNQFFGGNLRAQSSDVTITRSMVTGGSASSGGGISNAFGSLVVRDSSIFGNAADTGGGDGGAIQNFGNSDLSAGLTVQNSTISGNSARLAGGIISGGNSGNEVTIESSTIASNSSTVGPSPRGGGGGLLIGSGFATVENSIIALNASITAGEENCSVDPAAGLASSGFNIESGSECGFDATSDLQSTNPLLAPLQNAGGPTDTRPLLPGSPAIDAANNITCFPTDQRGVARPQGARCDIGAFEVAIPAAAVLDTTIVSGPGAITKDRTPTFTFSSTSPGASFECSLDKAPYVACSSPFTAPELAAGAHTFEVRARAAGAVDPTPAAVSLVIPKELRDLPPPKVGKTVNAEPVSGLVLVAGRGISSASGRARAAQKGLAFIPLREARQVRVGSFFNTRKGRVRLQTATPGRGKRQAGVFYSGLFQTLQSRKKSSKGLTELRLKGSSFERCRATGKGAREVSSSARSRRRIRRLSGNARGRFRTRGRYSAATVRGTIWGVTDRCDGTLTKVTRGKVAVRDFRRRKNVLLRTGKSYFARAPR